MLTVPQAARELGVPVTTLYSRIETGTCAAVKLGPRAILVSRAEVERQRTLTLRRGPRGKGTT